MIKNIKKNCPKQFLIAQKKRLDALNATQKTTAPNNARFLKNNEKKLQKIPFLTKTAKNGHF